MDETVQLEFERRARAITERIDALKTKPDELTVSNVLEIESESNKLCLEIDAWLDFLDVLTGVEQDKDSWRLALIKLARRKLRLVFYSTFDRIERIHDTNRYPPELRALMIDQTAKLNATVSGVLRWFAYAAPTDENEVLVYHSVDYEKILYEAHLYAGALVEFLKAQPELGLWVPVVGDFESNLQPELYGELMTICLLRKVGL
jgi:hypothetical protein